MHSWRTEALSIVTCPELFWSSHSGFYDCDSSTRTPAFPFPGSCLSRANWPISSWKKKKLGIKIRLVYELNNFPKIDLRGPCCPSLCMKMYYFATKDGLWVGPEMPRRQWERREKRGPQHFNRTSKQNTDACALVNGGRWELRELWGCKPRDNPPLQQGILHPVSDCDYVLLVAQEAHWPTLVWEQYSNTGNSKIACPPSEQNFLCWAESGRRGWGLTHNLRFAKMRVPWSPFVAVFTSKLRPLHRED